MKFIEWYESIINVESITMVKKNVTEFISRDTTFELGIILDNGDKMCYYYNSKEELDEAYNALRDILIKKRDEF